MLKDFQQFILRGNVVDLAVGIIIGAAFTAIVNSFVADLIMPPIGLALGNVDFSNMFVLLKAGTTPPPYASLEAAKTAGAVTLNYGVFVTQIINFLIVAFVIFLVVRAVNALQAQFEKKQAETPAAPAAPTTEEKLLTAIEKLNTILEKKL